MVVGQHAAAAAQALKDSKSGATAASGHVLDSRGDDPNKTGEETASQAPVPSAQRVNRGRANQSGDQDSYKMKILKDRHPREPPLEQEEQ